MKGKTCALVALLVLLVGGIAAVLLVYNQKGFTGGRTKNPDMYSLDIVKMNGEDQHSINLDEGDVLLVNFDIKDGKMTIEIEDPSGEVVFSGNEKNSVNEFEINIVEAGNYTIKLDAKHAKGSVLVKQK